MKRIVHLLAALALGTTLHAQSFNFTGGAAAPVAFDPGPGISISALGGDAQGNLVYLARGSFDGISTESRLIRRSAADNFASETTLYTYPSPVFGSFVTLSGGTAYFGDSFPLEEIRTAGIDDPDSQSNSTAIRKVTGNFTLAFSGGSAFLVADPTFSNAQVYQFDLFSGALQSVLNTQGDTTGPIAFNSLGDLFYGRSGADFGGGNVLAGDIFRFTAAEIAASLASGIALTFDGRTPVVMNDGNQYFALGDDTTLFQTRSDFDEPNKLLLYNLLTGSGTLLGSTGGTGGENFSGLTFAGGQLYAAVTDFNAGHSLVFVVPEPGTGLSLALGVLALSALRRRAIPA